MFPARSLVPKARIRPHSPDKAELLPKFSPENVSCPPSPKPHVSQSVHLSTAFPPPLLQRQLG